MKTVLLIFLSVGLFANTNMDNFLDQYRRGGVKQIKKQLDMQLTTKEYWQNYLKQEDTTFGYLEKYSSILACDKNTSTLELYKQEDDKTFKLIKQYPAYTGKQKGDKVTEGDLRTPIGIYNITKKIVKLDSFYGPLAFVTSYPNDYDQYKGKDGHGIWIHGLPLQRHRESFTKGCIAINNTNIKNLEKQIDINSTLLIIDKDKINKNISKDTLADILSQLYMWRYTWIYNDIDKYLNFYSNDFVKDGKMNFDSFAKYKKRIFAKNEQKEIIFKDLNIIKYPNTKDVYQITFEEVYNSNSFSFRGKKTLIIRLIKDNIMQIFIEK